MYLFNAFSALKVFTRRQEGIQRVIQWHKTATPRTTESKRCWHHFSR